MNQTQELYWCMCNHCLIKNQGVPYNQIRLYIDTTCRKHNCAHEKLFKKCTRYGWIKPVEGACYPTYPCPPDCDVAQHFLSWLSANASEDIVRLNLYLKSRHRHHVDPGAGNHTAGEFIAYYVQYRCRKGLKDPLYMDLACCRIRNNT